MALSYPWLKVRDSKGERQTVTAQDCWPRGASRRPRGREELPRVRGKGRQPRGASSRPKSGAATPPRGSGAPPKRSYPTAKERLLRGRRRAERSYSTVKVRSGGREEIPLVQGKEQQLHFAGAAVKRYPTSKARETQVRRQVLREGIRGQTD